MASGVGGRPLRLLWGWIVLYSRRQFLIAEEKAKFGGWGNFCSKLHLSSAKLLKC
jgi:hypothetical protein